MNSLKWIFGWCCALCLMAVLPLQAQTEQYRLMTYNVENLFDLADNPLTADDDFLPTGACAWDSLRYRGKLAHLSRAILAAGGDRPVDLVALCEVENDTVLRDLTEHSRMARLGYRFLITHSRDRRGINVALLYQPERFLPVSVDTLCIAYDARNEQPTRDLLHVAGRILTGDTLDVIVAHWPSRRGGAARTAAYRCRVAARIRSLADSLCRHRAHAAVVIAGDFNDEPDNRSVRQVLGAAPQTQQTDKRRRGGEKQASAPYVNLSANLTDESLGVRGTYKYQKHWNRLDHIIVNKALLNQHPHLSVAPEACRILSFPFLLERETESWEGVKPHRTFQGSIYHGGTSDHLPLLLQIMVR